MTKLNTIIRYITLMVLVAMIGCGGRSAPQADFILTNPNVNIVTNITIWYGVVPIPLDVTLKGETWLNYSHTNALENGKSEGEVAISLINGTIIAQNEESSLIDIVEEHIPAKLSWDVENTLIRLDVKEFDLTPILEASLTEEDTDGVNISVSPVSFQGLIPAIEVQADLMSDEVATGSLNNKEEFELTVAWLDLLDEDNVSVANSSQNNNSNDTLFWHKELTEEPIKSTD